MDDSGRILRGGLNRTEYMRRDAIIDLITGLDEFNRYRIDVTDERTGRERRIFSARAILGYIPKIKNLIPSDIREEVANRFDLSEEELYRLEMKAKSILGIKDAEETAK